MRRGQELATSSDEISMEKACVLACNAFVARVIIRAGYVAKHALNSLCHVLSVAAAFIDSKTSSRAEFSDGRERKRERERGEM